MIVSPTQSPHTPPPSGASAEPSAVVRREVYFAMVLSMLVVLGFMLTLFLDRTREMQLTAVSSISVVTGAWLGTLIKTTRDDGK